MGRLANASPISQFLFAVVIKTINKLSLYSRIARFTFKRSPHRSFLIFQNPLDQSTYQQYTLRNLNVIQSDIVPGSGVPEVYVDNEYANRWLHIQKNCPSDSELSLIFCSRLLASKGIYEFLELCSAYPSSAHFIFGAIDNSTSDSLSEHELKDLAGFILIVAFWVSRSILSLVWMFLSPIFVMPSNYGEDFLETYVKH